MTGHRTRLAAGLGLIVAAVLLVQQPVLACPVCFGAVDSPAVQGMDLAIFTLMGVTGSVLASFVGFFLYLFKRARAQREGPEWHEDAVQSRG